MTRFKQFALNHPVGFTFVAVLLMFILMGGAAALAVGLFGYEMTDVEPQLNGQIVATLGFLFILWRFDWLGAAGISRLGSRRWWLITLIVLIYTGLVALYAFFGSLRVGIAPTAEMVPELLQSSMAGVMEEVLFRGLILYVLVSRWGSSRFGVIAAVLLSAFLFGGLHFFNLALSEPAITAAQVLEASLSAILYGALVLVSGSIWPAIALHSFLNLLVNAVALSLPAFSVTFDSYLTLVLFDIPLTIYGFYLISKLPLRLLYSPEPETNKPALVH